ncbi:MAG: RnfH family protein [Methylovulum sp.]|nr:RnfH family protein [Methylovulum sp.]
MSELLAIEVAYATPDQQILLALQLQPPATVGAAIEASGIVSRYPELAGATLTVGIFGRVTALEQPLKTGDRVEIYRPLIHDPKEARRQRAAK